MEYRIRRSFAFDRHWWLAGMTLILMLIAASRIVQLNTLQMDGDDIWSIWQTFGSPLDIIRWTPPDWPPLYFLSLGAWKELVGIQPIVLRFGSALVFLIGVACLYRLVQRLWGERAALAVVLAYSALGFVLYLSLFIRAYVFLLTLTPLVFWMAIRYFDCPSARRAVWVALGMAAMFYSHYTSLFLFGLLGLYTLAVYPRQVWRWWLPGLMLAAVTVPHLIAKRETFATRTIMYQGLQLAPLPEALLNLATTFAGPAFPWLALLFAAASVLILARRALNPQVFVLAVWALMPVAVYLLQNRLGLFQSPKYLWWVLPGLALWIGWGLSRLPRTAYCLALVSLVGVMFLPNTLDARQPALQFDTSFKLLRQYLRAGDVVMLDPRCQCSDTESWDYFMRLYFPNGLPFVTDPVGHPRIWYVERSWDKDEKLEQSVARGRIAGVFFGPPTLLFRLYEGPPDPKGILFENGMRFHGATVDGVASPDGVAFRAGETVRLKLWWSVDQPIKLDYSLGVYLLVDGAVGAEVNGPPQVADEPKETSRWIPGRYYVDERALTLPARMYGHAYPLYMAVYQWWDNARIAAPGVDGNKLLTITLISIHAW
jgi:hypothetical protein